MVAAGGGGEERRCASPELGAHGERALVFACVCIRQMP